MLRRAGGRFYRSFIFVRGGFLRLLRALVFFVRFYCVVVQAGKKRFVVPFRGRAVHIQQICSFIFCGGGCRTLRLRRRIIIICLLVGIIPLRGLLVSRLLHGLLRRVFLPRRIAEYGAVEGISVFTVALRHMRIIIRSCVRIVTDQNFIIFVNPLLFFIRKRDFFLRSDR